MIEIIVIFFIVIVSLLVGYALGGGFTPKTLITKVEEAIKTIEHKKEVEQSPVGAIERPSQEEILARENPVIEEGKEEFAKLLNTLPIKPKENEQ